MTNEAALEALTRALEVAEPKLEIKTTHNTAGEEYVTHVAFTGPKDTSRMMLASSYYTEAVEDPERLAAYADRIVAKLKAEVGL